MGAARRGNKRKLSTGVSNGESGNKNLLLSDSDSNSPNPKRAKRCMKKETPRRSSGKTLPLQIKEEEEETSPYQLSVYELQIQKNIAEKNKLLESLAILKVKEELLELTPKPIKKPQYRGIAREPRTPINPGEVRKSLRQRKLAPDGTELQLPSDATVAKVDSTFDDKPRPPPGPAPMIEYYEHHNKDQCQEFIKELRTVGDFKERKSVWSSDSGRVLKLMKSLKIKENLVAKVTSKRTFSIKIHPSPDKTLLLVGGKWGDLGIWDVERNDECSGAYSFNPHSRPINCLSVSSLKPEHIYSTSYDGTLRRTDLVSGTIQEVYCYCKPDVYREYISCHASRDENCMLVASSEGSAIHIDLRKPKQSVEKYAVHKMSVKIISVHPTMNHYFATSSKGTVALWDLRHHKKNTPISEVIHGRLVSGLEFSPVTGKSLITTSNDNYLRFLSCDLTALKTERKIHHNNLTGRWLTNFKASFVPNNEDLVVVGSMMYPRRIEVWDSNGNLQHQFMGENFSSVTSITAMHPTHPIIAGSNSSGKAFVFM